MVLQLLHGYSLTLNSLPRHQSSVTGNDDHSGDNRHGFESGSEASRNDDDEGFEIDVGATETSLAVNQSVVTDSSGGLRKKVSFFLEKWRFKMTNKESGNLSGVLP